MEYMQETFFHFAGRSSEEFGLKICHDGGLFERQLGTKRKPVTETAPGNPFPFYYGFEQEPLSGDIQLLSELPWTRRREREVCEWLFRDGFAELISADNPDMVYYVMFTDDGQINKGSDRSGFITVHFTCDAPWGWSHQLVQQYEIKAGDSPFHFTVDNISNVANYNALELELTLPDGKNDISPLYRFRNTRTTLPDPSAPTGLNDYRSFVLAQLEDREFEPGETIYINTQREQVRSDNSKGLSRFANCNRKFVPLARGVNQLEYIGGAALLTVRCRFPILR